MLKLPKREEMSQVKGCALAPPSGLLFVLSPIYLCHKIKDGGYNNTNMNKLSPTQNTPAVQATWGAEAKTFLSDARQPEVDLFHSWEEV